MAYDQSELRRLSLRIEKLERERDNLRAALKPFALLLADRHDLYKDDAILPVNVMVGWLRKADQVLKGNA